MERDRATNTEIEITPEMIKAGVSAYYEVDRRVADADFMVMEIFRAMMGALRTSPDRPHSDSSAADPAGHPLREEK